MTKQRERFRNLFSFNVGISKQSRCFLNGVIDRNVDDVTEEIRIWQTAASFEHLSALEMERATRQIDEFLEVNRSAEAAQRFLAITKERNHGSN
jgi:hypothetical protein